MVRFIDMYIEFSESPKMLKINISKTINYSEKYIKNKVVEPKTIAAPGKRCRHRIRDQERKLLMLSDKRCRTNKRINLMLFTNLCCEALGCVHEV